MNEPPKDWPLPTLNEVDYLTFMRGKIVAIAEAIIDGDISIIAGARRLSLVSLYTVESDYLDEEYFALFEKIDVETMHLPVGWEWKNWSQAALIEKDRGITAYESRVREEAVAACRQLVERYNAKVGV